MDLVDFVTFAGCFGATGNPLRDGCQTADLDADGAVDLTDFVIFAANFGASQS